MAINLLQTAPILRKAEEIKRKVQSTIEAIPEKRNIKTEGNNTGANDKSLRLLEKELQELKRVSILFLNRRRNLFVM